MAFVRNLSNNLIEKLKNKEELFFNDLLADIEKCEVFPAVRNNEIHFYYKGGRLFKYTDAGFSSHIKYAFVCPDDCKNGDIKESDLTKIKPVTSFHEGYKRIKEYCAKYNESSESEYVSRLFREYSYINPDSKDDIVLLDIEAAFAQKEGKSINQDRFDIVLLNKNTRTLKIVEAKLYSNPELHPSKNSAPQVIDQIKRYEDKIEEKKEEILKAYNNYVNIMNDLFDKKIPPVEAVDSKVGLLYFAFDDAKKKSETFKSLKEDLAKLLPDNKIYAIGDTKGASLKLFF